VCGRTQNTDSMLEGSTKEHRESICDPQGSHILASLGRLFSQQVQTYMYHFAQYNY
jgi:hypothetical protein